MIDFIYKLYSYDNFTLYLTIALIVLVILFILVFIFGKKDQKLEETKRLQKIELEKTKELELKKEQDTFKEESIAEKVEVKDSITEQPKEEEKSEIKLNPILPNEETMLIPNINQMALEDIDEPVDNNTKEEIPLVEEAPFMPLMPEIEDKNEVASPSMELNSIMDQKKVTMTIFEPSTKGEEIEALEEPPIVTTPRMHKEIEEEQMPISVEDIASFKFDDLDQAIESDLTTLESIKKEFNSIELPDVSLSNEANKSEDFKATLVNQTEKSEKKTFTPSQVFSSVFVAKEESAPQIQKEVAIDLPKANVDDEDEFDLPTLKTVDEIPLKEETKVEQSTKKENVFSFDDLVN